MTRRSKREVERALDAIGEGSDATAGLLVGHREEDTGELRDLEGALIDPDADDVLIVVPESVATNWEHIDRGEADR